MYRGVNILFQRIVGLPEPADPFISLSCKLGFLVNFSDCLTRCLCSIRVMSMLPDLEKRTDDNPYILGTKSCSPAPTPDETPSILGTPSILSVRLNRGHHLVKVIERAILE